MDNQASNSKTHQDNARLHPKPDEILPPPQLEVPDLPSAAKLDEELGFYACPWLDAYIEFSRKWAPRSFDGYHESCGIWLLSVIAARRIKTEFGGPRFTPLYILLAGRSSLYSKTTAAKIALAVLRKAGFNWMLAPDQSTPQKFISFLSRKLPDDYDDLSEEKKESIKRKLGLLGACGWFHEEFGSHISSMMQPNGFMAEFRGLLRIFDDCPESYEYATIGRGTDYIEKPYLALLGNITPADLRKFANKGSELWGDGFLARFTLVCPSPEEDLRNGRFPNGVMEIPENLINPLVKWHKDLGSSTVVISPPKDEDSKDTNGSRINKNRLEIQPGPVTTLEMSEEIRNRFYAYMNGLAEISKGMDNMDLDSNYVRFPEKALRIATLLTSLSGSKTIEQKHWARAQAIAERWRYGLHALYESINNNKSTASEQEDKVLGIVDKLGGSATPTEIKRYIRGMGTLEIKKILDGLVCARNLEIRQDKKAVRYAFITDEQ